eukprot:TRINITY_DN6739_c0_g5_i1.p1 TRINITY_DN6739_c0_g5~~TRINITY_DN6739_c0_g5_i1.p1  ORF type:complete len:279 (-),score=60.47 TRINITY_DN6739_c0_g5_i1:374-1117(-)
MGSLVPGWDQDQPGQKPYGMNDQKEDPENSLPWWLKGSKDATAFQDTQARLEQEQFEQELSRSPGKQGALEAEAEGGRPSLERLSSGKPGLERRSLSGRLPPSGRASLERKSTSKQPTGRRSSDDTRARSFSQIDDIIIAADQAVELDSRNAINFDVETDDQGKIKYQWWKRMNTSELNERQQEEIKTEDYRSGSYIPQYDVSVKHVEPKTKTKPQVGSQDDKENIAENAADAVSSLQSSQAPLILI